MSKDEMEDTMYNTVLTKLVKSQTWMKSTHIVPHDFIIFCWLPDCCPEGCGDSVQALVERVRSDGWSFYLKLMVPTEPGPFFPQSLHSAGQAEKAVRFSRTGLARVLARLICLPSIPPTSIVTTT